MGQLILPRKSVRLAHPRKNDDTDTLRDRHFLERYCTCKDAAGVEKVQEQVLAELEESYAAARRAPGTKALHNARKFLIICNRE